MSGILQSWWPPPWFCLPSPWFCLPSPWFCLPSPWFCLSSTWFSLPSPWFCLPSPCYHGLSGLCHHYHGLVSWVTRTVVSLILLKASSPLNILSSLWEGVTIISELFYEPTLFARIFLQAGCHFCYCILWLISLFGCLIIGFSSSRLETFFLIPDLFFRSIIVPKTSSRLVVIISEIFKTPGL